MKTTTVPAHDLSAARHSIEQILHTFLGTRRQENPQLGTAIQLLQEFITRGGKRIRPLMCCCGYLAAAGEPPTPTVLCAAASLEIFHAFALIHDDIMDASDTRRGRPTLHLTLAARSRHSDPAEAARDGINQAILIGDLAFAWSDQILHSASLDASQLASIRPVLDAMRSEMMTGQFLDIAATRRLDADVAASLQVIRYKTAKYTIERPLHLGAALALAPRPVLHHLTAYALPLGEAFQLRDDLLGVFGDPTTTGKSRLDDLREGKRTTLIALALRDAAPAHRARLRTLVGDPELTEAGAEQVRDILNVSGARRTVEEMIGHRREQVLSLLDDPAIPLHPAAVAQLRTLADTTTKRMS